MAGIKFMVGILVEQPVMVGVVGVVAAFLLEAVSVGFVVVVVLGMGVSLIVMIECSLAGVVIWCVISGKSNLGLITILSTHDDN